MKLWLILLGVATVLTIALRRVRGRQAPLNDELYAKRVAVDYVLSGVAWVGADGIIASVNDCFVKTFRGAAADLAGREWYRVFRAEDERHVRDQYSQLMLRGVVDFEADGERGDRSLAHLRVRMVAVHDGQMRFAGHHLLIEDKTRERELERRVSEFEGRYRAAGQNVINALQNAKRATEEPAPQLALAH